MVDCRRLEMLGQEQNQAKDQKPKTKDQKPKTKSQRPKAKD